MLWWAMLENRTSVVPINRYRAALDLAMEIMSASQLKLLGKLWALHPYASCAADDPRGLWLSPEPMRSAPRVVIPPEAESADKVS